MDDSYVIFNKNSLMYLHYNPHTNIYFPSPELVGAIAMKKDVGVKFILDELEKDWILRTFKSGVTGVKVHRNLALEKECFDMTHK